MSIQTDMTLFALERAAKQLLDLTEKPAGLAEMEADNTRWFGVLLAFSLIGSRLTQHLGRDYEKRLRVVGQ